MSKTKKIARPRCAWCGAEIKGKLRLAARWRGEWYCNAACAPTQGQRGRTRATRDPR
jgi:hypothetical protein